MFRVYRALDYSTMETQRSKEGPGTFQRSLSRLGANRMDPQSLLGHCDAQLAAVTEVPYEGLEKQPKAVLPQEASLVET